MEALIMFIPISGIPSKRFRIEFEFDPASYPFPHIPKELKPPRTVKAANSTSKKSITQTSPPILNLSRHNLELRIIKFSDDLWANLIHYADPTRFRGHGNFDRNTLNITDEGKTEADPTSTAFGVLAMHGSTVSLGWESAEAIVNSQQSSRDVVFEFICRFTRFAILQRYLNELEPEDNQVIQLNHQAHWRTNVVAVDQRCEHTKKAGRADGILECRKEGGRIHNNAMLMSKSNWGYDNTALAEIFDRVVVEANGDFAWDAENTSVLLLRQFWGSIVAMGCKFGIWTNGETIFLAVRRSQNELVVTRRHNWFENEAAKAIIGLTYAAIDEDGGKWAERGVDIISELIGQTE